MILLEIKRNEISAILVKGKGSSITVKKTARHFSKEDFVSPEGVSDKETLKAGVEEILNKFAVSRRSEKVYLNINLDNTLIQSIKVPQVSDFKLNSVVNSSISTALDGIDDFVVDYSVVGKGSDLNGKNYEVIAFGLKRALLEEISSVFEGLGVELRGVDVSPNGVIKLFDKSTYTHDAFDEHLFVDVSKDTVTFNHFINSRYQTTLIESVSESVDTDEFVNNISSSIFRVKNMVSSADEGLNIILSGKMDTVNELWHNLREVHPNIKVSIMEFPAIFKNSLEDIIGFMGLVGSTIRLDEYLSRNKKYDINMLSKINSGGVSAGFTTNKKLIAAIAVTSIGLGSFVAINMAGDAKTKKEISTIETYLTSLDVVNKAKAVEKIESEIKILDDVVKSIDEVKLGIDTRRQFDSVTSSEIVDSVPINSKITDITYDGVWITIELKSKYPATFSNYATTMRTSKFISDVVYDGYTEESAIVEEGEEATSEYTGVVRMSLSKKEVE